MSSNPDVGGLEANREATLHARIAELETRIQSQARELETSYALLGRERAERLRIEATLRQEQRLSKALFEHAPIAIQIFDRRGFSLRLNETQRELRGLPDTSHGVGSYNALSDPLQILSGMSEIFRRAYAGEAIHLAEQMVDLNVTATTGQTTRETVRYNQHLQPVFDDQGLVEAVISFSEDISEAYERRRSLSTANQLIESFFEYTPLAIQIFDREGFSFRMNELNRRLLGAPTRDYGTGQFNALTDPFMIAQGHAALFARAYAGEVVHVPPLLIDLGEANNTRDSGRRTARVEQVLFPVLDEDGTVSAVVSCVVEAIVGPALPKGVD